MNKLGHIAFIAKDIKKLRNFYQEVFDIVLDFETDDRAYAEYRFSQQDTPKLDFEDISLLETDIPNFQFGGVFLRFESDDLEMIRQRCIAGGGKIIREPIVQPYGATEMYIEDPEGNLIQVYKK